MWIKCKDEFRNEGLPVFVKIFTVKKRLIRCELKITATGIFGVKVNGKTLSDRFMPGWSNYRKHIDVCTYDITEYLTDGSENEIAVTVANGWYSGKLGYGNKTNVFGKEKRLLASIFLVYENGDTEKIESDESWKTIVSDVVSADFFDGEIIDAGRRKAMKQSGNAVKAEFSVPLQNYEREPVCVTERIKPQLVYGDETTLRYDFGYNFAGGVKVIAKGRKGSRIAVKYGETLDENGNVYTANLRRAKCTDEFILSGEEDVFEPEFTYHGFKYAELRKTRETEILSIEGAVFSQNINYYGKFECSDEVTNGVWRMALRGQKSNFISIPTDCPQRDERLGWTGDAEVFCNSAMFNADCNLFFKNYLKLVREDALPDGKIPSIVPFYMPLSDNTAGVPGWGDCITVIPYFHYLHYRDKSVIVDNFPVAEKWIAYYLAKSKNYLTKITNNFGDWLSVHGDSDPDVINQCFFGYSVALMAKMCEILVCVCHQIRPSFMSADIASTVSYSFCLCSSFSSVHSGSLKDSVHHPAFAIAVLIGIGFVSMKHSEKNGANHFPSRSASSQLLSSAACIILAISCGKRFDATLMTPSPPIFMRSRARLSSPLRTMKSSPVALITSSICLIEPEASLTAVMLGQSSASLFSVSVSRFTPVRPFML